MDLQDVSLQIGRTVVSLTVKKGRRFLPACFGGATNKKNLSISEQDSDSEVDDEEESGENDQEVNSPVNRSNNEQSVRNPGQTSPNNNSPISIRAANQIQGQEAEEESEEEDDEEEEEEEQNVQDLELPVAGGVEDNESDRSAGVVNNLNIEVHDQSAIQQNHIVVGSMTLNHQNNPHSAVEDGPVD